MAKFKRSADSVDAVQYLRDKSNVAEILEFTLAAGGKQEPDAKDGVLVLSCPVGVVHLAPGEWLISPERGRLDRMPSKMFDERYEVVHVETPPLDNPNDPPSDAGDDPAAGSLSAGDPLFPSGGGSEAAAVEQDAEAAEQEPSAVDQAPKLG